MFNTLLNKKGISLIEVSVALFLLSLGVLALISLQPSAWRLSGKSDYLGRASGILQAQLQVIEAKIMNPQYSPPSGKTTYGPTIVYPGGQGTAKKGDVPFTVVTTIEDPTITGEAGIWRVTVQVTWPGGTGQGIRESLKVAQQEAFRQ